MIKTLKKRLIIVGTLFCCLVLSLLASFSLMQKTATVSADTVVYRTGANGAHSTYKSSKYYKHVTSINLTGDNITDTLACALSQLGYYEGKTSGDFSGLYNTWDNYDSAKVTEFVYNYGDADDSGYKMAWCASFCSWALYQSRTTNHSTHSQSCRNHIGEQAYIWRECSCYQWADQLKRFNLYSARGSGYTPKTGDLIFFKMDGGGSSWSNHIGLVRYCDGSKVYTVEGNRHNHVDLFSYSLTDTQICGYGKLPYQTNDNVPKVDYTGKNKTEGQYITNNVTLAVSSTKGGTTSFSVGKYEMFNVTGFDGEYAKIEKDGKTGFAKLTSSTIQVTATKALKKINVTFDGTSVATTCFAGGTAIPESNRNESNPNFKISGLGEDVNSYKGLENFSANKEKVLINGRTWAKWEDFFGDGVLGSVWVYGIGDGKAYLGIELKNNSIVRLKGASGLGEEIQSIVFKRGFDIVNVAQNSFDGDEITSSSATGIVGYFKENVILLANKNGGFDVYLGGDSSLDLSGYNLSKTREQLVKLTADANVRSGPDTTYSVLGTGLSGNTFTYLNEIQNGKWLKIEFNGKVGFISNVNATVINAPQTVTLTADANIRSGPDTSYASLGTGTQGSTYTYLDDTQNNKWLKVDYNGTTGWISNVNANLSSIKYIPVITALNEDWEEIDQTPDSVSLDDVENREYIVIKLSTYNENCSANVITLKLLDHEDERYSNVFLGYTSEQQITDLTGAAFLDSVKINNQPIKNLFPSAALSGTDKKDGLAIKNISLVMGDQISVDKNAVFINGGVKAKMTFNFRFTYMGTEEEQSFAAWNIPDYSKEVQREYSVVKVSLYHALTSAEKIAFRFYNNEHTTASTVDLGYSAASAGLSDEYTAAFLEYITLNGKKITEPFPNAKICAMSEKDGLSLEGISLKAGDVITIAQGAIFDHNGVKMTMQFKFTFTYDGTSLSSERANDPSSAVTPASNEITGGDTPVSPASSGSKVASCQSAAGSSDIMFISAISIAAAGFVLLKKRKARENE